MDTVLHRRNDDSGLAVSKAVAQTFSGHFWTITPYVTTAILTPPLWRSEPFRTEVFDPLRGVVPIVGVFSPPLQESRRLVILMHGVAASIKEAYLTRMTRSLNHAGYAVLNLALRGSMGTGSDHYHAGLTDDLNVVLNDQRFASYDAVYIIGYSLGGQIAMRFAVDTQDKRLKGVVALCSPLSMKSSQLALDKPRMLPYRQGVLAMLKRKYRALMKNGERTHNPVMGDWSQIKRVNSFYDWDHHVVLPRYGFKSVDGYYERVSVVEELSHVHTPCLLVFTEHDPIVPLVGLKKGLETASHLVDVRTLNQGGHLGFLPKADLGLGPKRGLRDQVIHWLDRQV